MKTDNLMGYLGEYLKWRGDLTFRQSEFCYADSLALTMLSYLNPEEITSGEDSGILRDITIRQLSDLYADRYVPPEKKPSILSMTARAPELLAILACTARFADVRLVDYDFYIDTELEGQFAAMTFASGEVSIYVTYRGTDNNMIGWKEDFNMSYLSSVPAQESAVEYLNAQYRPELKGIIIGGHSKGGNLAVYGAAGADEKVKSRILEVHCFDGPGFSREYVQQEAYRSICGRTISFVPQGSFVGRLFEHQSEIRIVRSDGRGVLQHISFNWNIMGNDFLYAEEFDRSSEIFRDLMTSWLEGLDDTEKKLFIDSVFDILEDSGIEKTEELKANLSKIHSLMRGVGALSKENRVNLLKMIGMLLKETGYAVQKNLFSSEDEDKDGK